MPLCTIPFPLLPPQQKARAFKRRFSIESLHTQPHSHTGRTLKSHSRSTSNLVTQNEQNTKQLRQQPHSSTNLRLDHAPISSPPSTLNLGPLKESSGSHTVVSVVASPIKREERPLVNTTETSLSAPGSPGGKRKGNSADKDASKKRPPVNANMATALEGVSKLFNHNMPTAMIQVRLV